MKLASSLYAWKINDNYEGGVADAYYLDTGGDMFAEYKYIPALPVRPGTIIKPMELGSRKCTLQSLWLRNRYYQNKTVCVILGSPVGGVVFTHLSWEMGISAHDFRNFGLPPTQIARIISAHCLGQLHVYHNEKTFDAGRACKGTTLVSPLAETKTYTGSVAGEIIPTARDIATYIESVP